MKRNLPHRRVTLGDIEYLINEDENVASITGCPSNAAEINIPTSINHELKEYIVTSISTRAFAESKIKTVSFEPNSELRTIEELAFFCSKLESIVIPARVTKICKGAFYDCENLSSVTFETNSELRTIEKEAFFFSSLKNIEIPANTVELEDRWFFGAEHLIQIEVDPGNSRYSSVEGKMVIAKSDTSNSDYDTFIFMTHDTVEVKIPPTIKIIGSYAFSCSKLTNIKIPAQVTKICERAFYYCKHLSQVSFEPNSELQTIEQEAFSHSKLTSIEIPAHTNQICEGAFSSCRQISRFVFEPNSELQTIEKHAFSCSKLENIKIPAHVTKICEGAFYDCEHLSSVTFEPNSELRTIEKEAFALSSLARIEIPASAVELENKCFFGAEHLIQVEVDPGNSQYLSVGGKIVIGKSNAANSDYDMLVFMTHDTIVVKIPPTIKIIGSYAFSCSKLTSIEIPAHVTKICEGAFNGCKQLLQVSFEPNSELQTIEREAFSYSKLVSIEIPVHVSQIGERAFYHCTQLSRVSFEQNSKLQTIEKEAFSYSKLASIEIPAHVTKFCAFSCCPYFQIAEINEKLINGPIDTIKFGKCMFIMLPARKKLH